MTTIACRDGIMAADSLLCGDGVATGLVQKIYEMPDGSLMGACGAVTDAQAMIEWLGKPEESRGEPSKVSEDFFALILRADGTVQRMNRNGLAYSADAPFHAVGSGFEFALGAMAAGASAEEAARIACRYDIHSSEPVNIARVAISRLKVVVS